MKKAKTAVCVYKRNQDMTISVLSYVIIDSKGNQVSMFQNEIESCREHYRTFDAMYVDLICFAKVNGYRIDYYKAFDLLWFNIQFICMNEYSYHYGSICKYGLGEWAKTILHNYK